MVAVVSSNPGILFFKPSVSIMYRNVRFVLKTKNPTNILIDYTLQNSNRLSEIRLYPTVDGISFMFKPIFLEESCVRSIQAIWFSLNRGLGHLTNLVKYQAV